ncbi:MAG: NAD(P)/FAD-dependent oxidoreductase [Treponema sp.]|nr:MAG: NAD(P)/FAD-dependent oxidoreductase [Treponema sp.]
MSGAKRILIVGGGYAGVSVAKNLNKKYHKNNDIEIVLVDRNPFHTLMTELHEVAGMRTEPESVQVSFRKIFGGTKVRIITDTVVSIDFEAKKAVLTGSELDWDHIVIGTGAEPDYFGIPGIKENSFTLWSFQDAIRIRRHLEDIWARAAAESDPEKRKKMLTFVVAGAGFTGIEMMGELLELRKVMCRKHHIDPKDVRNVVVEAMPSMLAMLAEPLRVKAQKYLEKMNCEIMLSSPIVGAGEGFVSIKDGRTIETDTFIWTCGISGSRFAGALGFESKRNRILANAQLQVEGRDNVWIAGDNLWFLENEKPLPQIVETAHQTGELVAHNIIATLEGKPLSAFKSNYHGFMVSIGGKYGVADAGGIRTSGFFAMAIKHLINLYYLFTIAGVNQCWEYLKHEFLDIHHRRSIIGGFAEHKMRGYWPLLLRLWLGFSWVMEGVNKIGEGWLSFGLGSKSGWMFSRGVVQSGVAVNTAVAGSETAAVVDAVSEATEEWVEGAEEIAETVPVVAEAVVDAVSQASEEWVEGAEAVVEAVVEAGEPIARALGPVFDLSKPIFSMNGPVATWFRTTFMDGLFAYIPYPLFQTMIVAAEIAIGLALFGGAFTWFAAVASIGMCIVFTLSGMFSWNQLWFVFAAILCMGGAGRAFGLDYWIVRFAKRIWNGIPFVRRHHLYLDEPTK